MRRDDSMDDDLEECREAVTAAVATQGPVQPQTMQMPDHETIQLVRPQWLHPMLQFSVRRGGFVLGRRKLRVRFRRDKNNTARGNCGRLAGPLQACLQVSCKLGGRRSPLITSVWELAGGAVFGAGAAAAAPGAAYSSQGDTTRAETQKQVGYLSGIGLREPTLSRTVGERRSTALQPHCCKPSP